jgi:PTS system ascorbate-specific IIB component
MTVKVLAACGAGIGSSMIIKRKIQKVFDKLGVEVEITHASIGSAKTEVNKYDMVFTLQALQDNFTDVKAGTTIVGLVNIMSEEEIEKAVREKLGMQV